MWKAAFLSIFLTSLLFFAKFVTCTKSISTWIIFPTLINFSSLVKKTWKFSLLHRCVQEKVLKKHVKFREHFYKTSMQHANFSKTSKKFYEFWKNMLRNFRILFKIFTKSFKIFIKFHKKFQWAIHFSMGNFPFFAKKLLIASSSSIKLS